ncbi:MAG: fused response regulator/phosphatase [Bacteroidales bacterium]
MVVEDEDSFDALFADEDTNSEESTEESAWKVLIVDDEQDIHSAIKLALHNFVFKNKRISFFDAYSAEEARDILIHNNDIALILLDVVMETSHAGLDFVGYIRDELQNHFIRVVLWTGQPGYAPKKDVILQYEINDYKTKTDLTDDTIFTTVLSSIRSYNAIMIIESFRQELEEKVIERTAMIEAQKKKITDSILYAEKIQRSILPADEIIKDVFPESFIFFRPKDVVSGDFYWMGSVSKHEHYIVAADCTGHGVPGAFMSMIGTTMLNEIIFSKQIYDPEDICAELNNGVIDALTKHSRTEDAQSDGMDISICKVNTQNQTITISMANHNALLVRGGKVEIVEGDMASIGGFFAMLRPPEYSQKVFQLSKGDRLYMFSDGMLDQFGGGNNKKFTLNRFQQAVVEFQDFTMSDQGGHIQEVFEAWKGDKPQLDDVVVVGIQI